MALITLCALNSPLSLATFGQARYLALVHSLLRQYFGRLSIQKRVFASKGGWHFAMRLPTGVLVMRRIALCLALVAIFAAVSVAQTRQRRVGQSTPAPATSPSTPNRAPVLGGANRTPGNQPTNDSANITPDGPEEVDAGDVIRVNTTLVTIPVSVMDRAGRYVPNLRKEDFRLWEEGVEQNVAFFSSVDKPFSLVLMIDTSASTRFRLEDIQDAAIAFVNQLRQDDRVMVVSFDDQVRILSEFTSDRSRLPRRHSTNSNRQQHEVVRRSRYGDEPKVESRVWS